jgi:hypothetical protein
MADILKALFWMCSEKVKLKTRNMQKSKCKQSNLANKKQMSLNYRWYRFANKKTNVPNILSLIGNI